MKSWKTILPVVAVLGTLVAAIVHVRAQSVEQAASIPATVEVTKVSSTAQSTFPVSDRYSGNVGVRN